MIIAVGVVYNSARISLQERAWELASLAGSGFYPRRSGAHPVRRIHGRDRRREFRWVCWPRTASSALIARFHSNESFQIPAVIEPRTYLAATAIVVWPPRHDQRVRRAPPHRSARPRVGSQDQRLSMRFTIGRRGHRAGASGSRGRGRLGAHAATDTGRDGDGDQGDNSSLPSTRTARRASASVMSWRRRCPGVCPRPT